MRFGFEDGAGEDTVRCDYRAAQASYPLRLPYRGPARFHQPAERDQVAFFSSPESGDVWYNLRREKKNGVFPL